MRQAKRVTTYLALMLLFLSAFPLVLAAQPNWPGLGFGIFLLLESFWHSDNPSPQRLLAQGSIFTLTGLWKLVGGNVVFAGPYVSLTLTIQGVRNFFWLPRAHRLIREGFSEEQVQEMEQLCEHVLAARDGEGDVIEFKAGALMWFPWKCLLTDDWALLVNAHNRDVLLVAPEDIGISSERKVWLEKKYNARFHVRATTWTRGALWNGCLSLAALEKFRSWQNQELEKPD
jgi:hypothetical protein